jgi:glycine C-acetyltransferase
MSDPLSYLHDQLEQWRQEGTYQRLRILQSASAAESKFDGKEVINLASNNYLGLTTHPKLREAAIEAIRKFGVGSGAVRTISGTMSIHMELEERIAAFKNVEACVVFQSGFAANAGTVSALLTPEDHIISDELNHASIIDGCRLSRAKIHVFPHKDAAAAEKILAELDSVSGRKLLITDGVFSMDGDIGALPGLADAAEKHGAIMMVDDAHSSGVLGRNGRGTIDHFGLHGRVQVQVGTLSKAIGVLGGYVCGSRDLIEFLYHRARPFLFSTSHPPAVAAACLAAFDVLEQEPERIDNLWDNTRYFKKGLTEAGFNTGISETPITPIIVGEAKMAHELSRELFAEGVLATGIGFPTVPKGKARVRTIVTATHTKAELDRALEVFRKVGKKLAIL